MPASCADEGSLERETEKKRESERERETESWQFDLQKFSFDPGSVFTQSLCFLAFRKYLIRENNNCVYPKISFSNC